MRKGEKHSDESRKKMSEAKKGRVSSNKGKKFSDSWRKNLSEAHLGIRLSEKHRQQISIGKKNLGPKSNFWIDGRSLNIGYRQMQKRDYLKRRLNAEGGFTIDEWETLKAQYNWTCPSCKKQEPEMKLTIDHIIPLSKGGSNNIENIQPLCLSCNCRKHTMIIKFNVPTKDS